MSENELVFEQKQLRKAHNSITFLCLSCEGKDILCNICPVDEASKYFLEKLPDAQPIPSMVLNNDFDLEIEDLRFKKNNLIEARNSIEEFCLDCSFGGVLCHICHIHKSRVALACIPEYEDDEIPKETKKSKKKGCSTCPSRPKTKKKKIFSDDFLKI